MTDMTAFERQLSGEIAGLMGPVRPVDDLAVFESVTAASRPHRWGFSMFSALKFVAAGVIVALFGGFLLASILTAPQGDVMAPAAVTESAAPVTTEELLSGMVTEEVEPGVYRIDSDGVRDLSSTDFWRVVAGGDGSVWLTGNGGLIRLGDSEVPDPLVDEPYELADLEVTREGTAWAIVRSGGWPSRLLSFDGDAWTAHSVVDPFWKDQLWSDIEVAPSGRVWAVSSDDPILSSDMFVSSDTSVSSGTRLGYLEADGSQWQTVDLPEGGFLELGIKGFMATDLDLWSPSQDGFWHYADGEWESIPYEGGDPELPPDGVLWGFGWGGDTGDRVLYRYDGTGWGRWSLEEQGMRPGWGINAFEYAIAPDGSIWATWDGHISRFDGVERVRFLPETFVGGFLDISPDGAVWLIAWDRQAPSVTPSLYVITPEAVQ
jgi:hypothetical protein